MMTFSKTFPSSIFLNHLSETERKTVSEISEEVGCSQGTAKNALKSLEKEWQEKENKGQYFEWKILHNTVSGKILVWWKERQLTEAEIELKEIAELRRLMKKYPEVAYSNSKKMSWQEAQENKALEKRVQELEEKIKELERKEE